MYVKRSVLRLAIRSANRTSASFLIASLCAVFMRVASILLFKASTATRNCSSRSLVRAPSACSFSKFTANGALGMAASLCSASTKRSSARQTVAKATNSSKAMAPRHGVSEFGGKCVRHCCYTKQERLVCMVT
uniref:Uncharacterized protein n=1 Tax=Anopheles farauti TaxID=69004 RepID=A0A182Q7D5_9DIPT